MELVLEQQGSCSAQRAAAGWRVRLRAMAVSVQSPGTSVDLELEYRHAMLLKFRDFGLHQTQRI